MRQDVPDPSEDPRLITATDHALGRPEQLSGLRRRERPRLGPGGTLHAYDWQVGPWSRDLAGRPTGAAAGVAVDNVTALALLWAAEPEIPALVTTQLQINVLRPLPAFDAATPETGPLLPLLGTPLSHDALGGAARSALVAEDGTALVEAVGWFHVTAGRPEHGVQTHARHAAMPVAEEDRASMAAVVSADLGSIPGADPGVRPVAQDAPVESVRFRDAPSLDNRSGMTHGGIQTMRAVLAAQAAMPDRQGYDVQSVQVVFLRPGHGEQVAFTRVRHAGRSLRTVEVELVGVDPRTGAPLDRRPSIRAQVSFRATTG